MPKKSSSKKKQPETRRLTEAAAVASVDPLRPGMPSQDSIISVRPLVSSEAIAAAESLAVATYRIIQTNEVDAYEKAVAIRNFNWPGQWTSLASLYFARHQYDKALKTLLAYKERSPRGGSRNQDRRLDRRAQHV